jgi:hypothetical protein
MQLSAHLAKWFVWLQLLIAARLVLVFHSHQQGLSALHVILVLVSAEAYVCISERKNRVEESHKP